MELGPIALAGPDDDCCGLGTFASDRRSSLKGLGMATAVMHGQAHGLRTAQRCEKQGSLAASRSRLMASVADSGALQHAAESSNASASGASNIRLQNSGSVSSPGSARPRQPANDSKELSRWDSIQRRPFAATTLGGSRHSSRRRASSTTPSLGGRTATFVLASIPHASYLLAEAQAPALASLLVLSDTVRALTCQSGLLLQR